MCVLWLSYPVLWHMALLPAFHTNSSIIDNIFLSLWRNFVATELVPGSYEYLPISNEY